MGDAFSFLVFAIFSFRDFVSFLHDNEPLLSVSISGPRNQLQLSFSISSFSPPSQNSLRVHYEPGSHRANSGKERRLPVRFPWSFASASKALYRLGGAKLLRLIFQPPSQNSLRGPAALISELWERFETRIFNLQPYENLLGTRSLSPVYPPPL